MDGEDGNILPISTVRSVVAINPPLHNRSRCSSSHSSSPPFLSSGRHGGHVGRRGFPVGFLRAKASASVAMMSNLSDKLNCRVEGKECGNNDRERVTIVATCIPPMSSARDENSSRAGRISLAAIVDVPTENGWRSCLVAGMKYSATDSSLFSTVCIAQQNRDTSVDQPDAILLAIDTCGRLHTCPIENNCVRNQCNQEKNQLVMHECHFHVARGGSPQRGKKVKSIKKSTRKGKKSGDNLLPPLSGTSSLAARLESPSLSTATNADHFPNEAQRAPASKLATKNSSPVKRKGCKRKHSPLKIAESSSHNAAETGKSGIIHLVASNMNASIHPSESPPIIMLISNSDDFSIAKDPDRSKTLQWTGLSWSTIPGLENVNAPMTCILFASRSKCGPMVWDGIMSAMRLNVGDESVTPECVNDNEPDEGVVLMGFRDGSLRASLVATDKASASDGTTPNITLDVKKATTILQLTKNESLVSLQLISPPSTSTASLVEAPILICVGNLGTVVALFSPSGSCKHAQTPEFVTENLLKPSVGRWISLQCVGCRFLESRKGIGRSFSLSFVGINDSRHTYLYHLSLPGNRHFERGEDDGSGNATCGQSIYRIPIPAGASSSIHTTPMSLPSSCNHSSMHVVLFTMLSPSGKAVVLRMPLVNKMTPLHSHRNGWEISTLSNAWKGDGSSQPQSRNKRINPQKSQKVDHNVQSEPSKSLSLLQRLESVTASRNKNATTLFDSINHQSKIAEEEIREAIQTAAFVHNSSCRNVMSFMQCEIKKLDPQHPGVFGCAVTSEALPLARKHAATWHSSVHFLQSCLQVLSPMLRPNSTTSMSLLCYRRTLRGGGSPVKVVHGGTATSYNACGCNEDTRGSLRMKNIVVPMNDFMPIFAYSSLSMVYTNYAEMTSVNIDNIWYNSTKIANRTSMYSCLHRRKDMENEAARPGSFHLTGSAMPARFRRNDRFLGVSIPFDISAKWKNSNSSSLDILTYAFSSIYQGVRNIDADKKSRNVAEKYVLHWYQNRSSQTKLTSECVIPLFKEQQWICHRFMSPAKYMRTEKNRVYCCSSSIRCASMEGNKSFSEENELFSNMGFGPMATIILPHEAGSDINDVGFAIGSNIMNSSESMSMLPLMRQAILRRSKGHDHLTLRLLEIYFRLLSEKRTAKIAKHISKSSEELLADIINGDIVTAAISLYKRMRTINFAFGLH